jgi:hypothetical protein
MPVKGPTADYQVNAATKLYNPSADLAFQANIHALRAQNFGGKITALFLQVIHFFGYYGDVSGAKTLKAERFAIRNLKYAEVNLVKKLAAAAVTHKNKEETASFVADAQRDYYHALKGRIVLLTGGDLSKPDIIERQAELYNAGFAGLGQRIDAHNGRCKAPEHIVATEKTIKGQIASKVRENLVTNVTPEAIEKYGLPFLAQLAKQQIKVFGSKDPAEKIVAELRQEVIEKNGKAFDAQAKKGRSVDSRKEAVVTITAQINAECATAKRVIETQSKQCQDVLKQIQDDEAALKGAENVLASRKELFAIAYKRIGTIPSVVVSENPVQLLKTFQTLNKHGITDPELVILRNAKACAESLIAAEKQVKLIQNRIAVRLTQVDALTQGIAKAQETVRQTPARLNNIELIVKQKIENGTKILGYFASNNAISEKSFFELVYPKAPEKVEPKKVNVADVLNEKDNILKKAELLIGKEGVNNEEEGVEFEVLSSTANKAPVAKKNVTQAELNEKLEKTPLLTNIDDEALVAKTPAEKYERTRDEFRVRGKGDNYAYAPLSSSDKASKASDKYSDKVDAYFALPVEECEPNEEAPLSPKGLSQDAYGYSQLQPSKKIATDAVSESDSDSEIQPEEIIQLNAPQQKFSDDEIEWGSFLSYKAPVEDDEEEIEWKPFQGVQASKKPSLNELFEGVSFDDQTPFEDNNGNPFVDDKVGAYTFAPLQRRDSKVDLFGDLPRNRDSWMY